MPYFVFIWHNQKAIPKTADFVAIIKSNIHGKNSQNPPK